jgi:DNA polymerase-3 subunit delta'
VTPAAAAAPGTAGGVFHTRGQPGAVDAIRAMLRAGVPHALLLAGPAGVGKRTLADDIAAALLCRAEQPEERPDRVCRGCRALEHGNHPDVHLLAPTGAGQVIPIGGRDERGVRDLVRDLALLPVEGGRRVAIIADADRMTEDAQSAFLKTLEEPPAGTVLILTAADEERLLPTIRSRVVRIRLGPVARAVVEQLLVDAGLADAPVAARLARLAAGRPGDAVAMARAPEAVTIRAEIARTLLDLTRATRADRLRLGRDLLARAGALIAAVRGGSAAASSAEDDGSGRPAGERPSKMRANRAPRRIRPRMTQPLRARPLPPVSRPPSAARPRSRWSGSGATWRAISPSFGWARRRPCGRSTCSKISRPSSNRLARASRPSSWAGSTWRESASKATSARSW